MDEATDETANFQDYFDETLINDIVEKESSLLSENLNDSPQPEQLSALRRLFGHSKFRPMQWKIISSILYHKRDNCAVMSTGYGKSLCFQFPSAYTGGVTLVISPLISLMEDQVLALTVANIPACLLGTANKEQAKTLKEISENKYRLVYLTPELCCGDFGRELLETWSKSLKITLIAIDEAHCVSSWGHDFRAEYRKLGLIRDLLPRVPILAVTATATERVKNDIIKSLKLRNPQFLCSSFDRPNFYFAVSPKSDLPIADFRKVMECQDNKWKFSGPTIVYCITRKMTEEICELLLASGIKCAAYHAGLPLEVRKETHENFVRDKIDVVVATIAFGMGIDKPDVRNVIHYGVSNSMEGYYQEVGRAGRDGQPAKCVMFYNNNDFKSHEFLAKQGNLSSANRERKEAMLETIHNYAETNKCRRQFVLNYFEEQIDTSNRESCCDNCLKGKQQRTNKELYEGLDEDGKYNFSADARLLLSTVDSLATSYGLLKYVQYLRGSNQKKLAGYAGLPLHGAGKAKSELWWKELGNILIRKKFLRKISSSFNKFATLLEISESGRTFLSDTERELIEQPTQAMLPCLQPKADIWRTKDGSIPSAEPSTSTVMVPRENAETPKQIERRMKIYRLLLVKRTQIATKDNCMPYMVASNKALMDMSIMKPKNLKEMEDMNLDGFTAAKLEKFGPQFLDVIIANQEKLTIGQHLIDCPLPETQKINASANMSYVLFQKGKSMQEIAEERGFSLSTIEGHINSCLKGGFEIKLNSFGITKTIADTIIEAIFKCDTGLTLLTPIKVLCPDDITFSQVRALTSYLQIREHLNSNNLSYHEFDDPEYYETYKKRKQQKEKEKLDELIQGMEEMEDMDFTDDVLAAACDEMEKSLNESDETDVDGAEPDCKKSKTDFYDLLDSPPRSTDRNTSPKPKMEETKSNLDQKKEEAKPDSKQPKKDDLKLPPWLMKKRIA